MGPAGRGRKGNRLFDLGVVGITEDRRICVSGLYVARNEAGRAVDALAAGRGDGAIEVRGMTAEAVGDIAFEQAIRLHELTTVHASLEEAFMELTASSVEYHAGVPGTATASGSGA